MVHTLPTNMLDTCTDGLLYCFSKWASNVTSGLFFTLMLLAFVVVLFLATLKFGTTRAFGFASFFGMIGAVFLCIAQLMAWWVGTIFIIIGAIGLIAMVVSER